MSKENALRFMLLAERDQALRDRYNEVTDKYAGKVLTEKERERAVREEIIPIAKSAGCEFSLEEFLEALLPGNRQLADDELDKAVGGRGQYTQTSSSPVAPFSITYSCEKAEDDQTFTTRFQGYDGCPYFERKGRELPSWVPGPRECCFYCKHIAVNPW